MNDARWRRWRNRAADGLAWAVSLATVVTAVAGLFGALVGVGALLGVKLALFVVGWLLLGAGVFALRPRPPNTEPPWPDEDEDEDEDGEGADDGDSSRSIGRSGAAPAAASGDGPPAEGVRQDGEGLTDRIGAAVQAVPPARWLTIPPEDRLSAGGRLFVAAVTMLVVSFLLETAGVGV